MFLCRHVCTCITLCLPCALLGILGPRQSLGSQMSSDVHQLSSALEHLGPTSPGRTSPPRPVMLHMFVEFSKVLVLAALCNPPKAHVEVSYKMQKVEFHQRGNSCSLKIQWSSLGLCVANCVFTVEFVLSY